MAQKLSIPFFFQKADNHLHQNKCNYFITMPIETYTLKGKKCEAKLCGSLLWQLQRNQANTVKVENAWDRMITERNLHIHD